MKIRKLKPNMKKMNKKGSLFDIILWVIISFVIVVFFALWVFGFDLVTENLLAIDTTIGDDTNFSTIVGDTFGQVNTHQTTGLQVLSFVMIFMMILTILISNFLVKANPVFFILYIFIIIVAFIVSVYISNQYELLMTDSLVGDTISSFTGSSFIMLYLPIWVTIIGIFGAIFLFSGIIRDSGQGGSVV